MILDIRLPDGNGVEICRKLRDRGFTRPIIMLTGQNAEQDMIASLEAGANDYVIKPMRMSDLLASVKSQLWQNKVSDTARFSIGGLSFIPANKLLKSADETRKIILTEKESTILKYLYRAHPNCFRRKSFSPRSGIRERVEHTYGGNPYLPAAPEGEASHQQEYHHHQYAWLFTVSVP